MMLSGGSNRNIIKKMVQSRIYIFYILYIDFIYILYIYIYICVCVCVCVCVYVYIYHLGNNKGVLELMKTYDELKHLSHLDNVFIT